MHVRTTVVPFVLHLSYAPFSDQWSYSSSFKSAFMGSSDKKCFGHEHTYIRNIRDVCDDDGDPTLQGYMFILYKCVIEKV